MGQRLTARLVSRPHGYRAVTRTARAQWINAWLRGWYRSLMGTKMPGPASQLDRNTAVDVHQLRAGLWSGSAQYLHRIGRNPARHYPQCEDVYCQGARCPLCRETADTPYHVLTECPALMGTRLRIIGTIELSREEVRGDRIVAALAAASRYLQREPLSYGQLASA